MNKSLVLKKITDSKDTNFARFAFLYQSSFPIEELRPLSKHIDLMKSCPFMETYCLLEENEVRTIIVLWRLTHCIYIDYLATDVSFRNRHYGEKSLKIFLEKSLQPVVVEVELPDNELAIRRIGFYQRLGFHLEEHFNYCMPNYNNKGFTPMNLMIYPSLMSNEDCKNIAAEIYEKVYLRNWHKKNENE